MCDLLHGLTIVASGDHRALRVAARCLADLGASVYYAGSSDFDAADQLWLGTLKPLPAGADHVDLALIEHGNQLDGVGHKAAVSLTSASSQSRHAGETLDERLLAAVGGMAIAIGYPDRPPLPLPDGCLDALVGSHVASAGLAALIDRTERTEVAASDVVAWAVATNLNLYLPYAIPWHRAGRRASGSGNCYPWALFDAADGLYCLIGRTHRDWRSFIQAMGNPAWAKELRFHDPCRVGREYPEEADALVAPWVAEHTRARLNEIMIEHSFAGAPALRPEEVLALPSLMNVWRRAHDGDREIRVPRPPFKLRSTNGNSSIGSFHELLVLDLSWVWSGPAVSLALADLGATVVKVESATRPDNARMRGRPTTVATSPDAPELELAPYFHALNRGKLSVSLDLQTDAGRTLLRGLADHADVIVENLSPGVTERWGISPGELHETNPDCVFLSMRGYPDHPTTRGLRAYAPTLSSAAGIESLVAYPGEAPVGAMSVAFSDAFAASQGVLLCLAGLHARSAKCQGSAITLSQFDAAVLANGANLVAIQLGQPLDGLQPLEDSSGYVTAAQELPCSDWISSDLFREISSRWVQEMLVTPLPWRRDGELPEIGQAGPELGIDTRRLLGERLGLKPQRIHSLAASGTLR